jgi:hypothetical protein
VGGQQVKPHCALPMFETQAAVLGQATPLPQRQTGSRPDVSHHSFAPQHTPPQEGPAVQPPLGAHCISPASGMPPSGVPPSPFAKQCGPVSTVIRQVAPDAHCGCVPQQGAPIMPQGSHLNDCGLPAMPVHASNALHDKLLQQACP